MNTISSPKYEDAILASLIVLDEVRPILMPKLSKESFSQPDRGQAFEIVQELYDNGQEVDLLSVEQKLRGKLKWGDNEVSNIIYLDPIYSAHEEKVDELNDKKSKRQLLEGLLSLCHQIKTDDLPASDFLSKLENIIHDQVDDLQIPGLTYSEVLAREENKEKGQKLIIDDPFMVNTFFKHTGFHKGEILVPFADTGAGKTYWAVWLTGELLRSGYKGVFVIRESRAKKLFERYEKAFADDLSLLDNLIVADIEQGIGNLGDAVQTIKYHNAVSDIDFFVIDHLKILPVEGLKEWEETQRIQTVINRCIYLSQEVNALGIPISQVNRETLKQASGWGRDPDLHNLYGSSAIEQAAHMAVSIFRPSNYEDLCNYDSRGNLKSVKGPKYNDDPLDTYEPNSVFIRQKKVREGELYRKWVHFLHTDTGLVRPLNVRADDSPF